MSEPLDINKKYQEYYNQILSNTLLENIIKNVSYQANIKLANDVIAENETAIKNAQGENEKLKLEIVSVKTNNSQNENQKITSLEKSIKEHTETISRLNARIAELSTYKNEYDNIKHQVQHVDTFRNQLNKANEELANIHDYYKSEIEKLNDQIVYLKLTPAKRKKIDETKAAQDATLEVEEQPTITDETIKDGGSF